MLFRKQHRHLGSGKNNTNFNGFALCFSDFGRLALSTYEIYKRILAINLEIFTAATAGFGELSAIMNFLAEEWD